MTATRAADVPPKTRVVRLLGTICLLTVWALAGGALSAASTPVSGLPVATATVGVPCDRPFVDLDLDATSSLLGTYEITGRVRLGGTGELRVVVVSGPNEGRVLEYEVAGDLLTVFTDSETVGEDRIVAELSIGGAVVAQDTATHTWTETPPPPSLTLTPVQSVGKVHTQHVVSVAVSNWDGVGQLSVSVVDGPHIETSLSAISEVPPFEFAYDGFEPGTDSLRADLQVGDTTYSSDIATRTWVELSLSPPEAQVALGEPVFPAVLVRGTDEAPRLAVVEGPNLGAVVDLVQDGDTWFGRYVSERDGTDVLVATLASGLESEPARWTSVAPPPEVGLSPSGTSSLVDTDHTLQITVSGSSETPVVEVIRGVNVNRGIDVVAQGPGSFSATYRSSSPGEDFLQARLPDAGVQSDVVDHTWTEPPPPPTVDLSGPGGIVFPGSVVSLSVSTTGTTDTPVVAFVSGPSSQGQLTLAPNGSGAWSTSYTSSTAEGVDVIRASVAGVSDDASVTLQYPLINVVPPVGGPPVLASEPGPRASRSRATEARPVATSVALPGAPLASVVTPEDCLAVTVAPAGAASQAGEAVTFTATVLDDLGDPVVGAAVVLTGLMAGQADAQLTATTDENGIATFTHLRETPGTESLTAVATDDLGTGRGSTDHTWLPDQGISATIEPAGTVSAVGSTFTAVTTVRDDAGEPLAGAVVDFRAALPGTPALDVVVDDVVTDDDGQVRVDYTRQVAGTETISVVVTHDGREAQASTSHVWEAVPGLGVRFEPAGTTTLVGSEFTATVLVTLDGVPARDAAVVFTAVMPGAPDIVSPPATTGDAGLASHTYSRDVAGEEVVTAVVSVAGRKGQASIGHTWELVPGLQIDIGPPGESSEVDDDFTATVTVTDGEEPIEGATVSLVRSMVGDAGGQAAPSPEAAERSDPAQATDSDGRASFRWSRAVPGLERIEARVVVDDARSGQAAMAHVWLDDGSPGVDAAVITVVGGGGLSGSTTEIVGSGCPPSSPVDVVMDATPQSDDQALATTTADDDGAYRTSIVVPDVPVGRYQITGTCEPVTATGTLDVVVASSTTGTAGSAAATVSTVLTFFVLLGGQLLRMSTPLAGPGTG